MTRKGGKPGLRTPALSLLTDDPDFLAEVVERYQDGEKVVDIARDIGVSQWYLGQALCRAGCSLPRGGMYVGNTQERPS